MHDSLRFHPRVVEDLRRAIAWYDKISLDLGNRFRGALNAQFDAIFTRPNGFTRAFDDVRFARVKKFPYLILFEFAGSDVLILGVFHTASDPKKWRKRIPRP